MLSNRFTHTSLQLLYFIWILSLLQFQWYGPALHLYSVAVESNRTVRSHCPMGPAFHSLMTGKVFSFFSDPFPLAHQKRSFEANSRFSPFQVPATTERFRLTHLSDPNCTIPKTFTSFQYPSLIDTFSNTIEFLPYWRKPPVSVQISPTKIQYFRLK